MIWKTQWALSPFKVKKKYRKQRHTRSVPYNINLFFIILYLSLHSPIDSQTKTVSGSFSYFIHKCNCVFLTYNILMLFGLACCSSDVKALCLTKFTKCVWTSVMSSDTSEDAFLTYTMCFYHMACAGLWLTCCIGRWGWFWRLGESHWSE